MLEGTHKDYRVQLLSLHSTSQQCHHDGPTGAGSARPVDGQDIPDEPPSPTIQSLPGLQLTPCDCGLTFPPARVTPCRMEDEAQQSRVLACETHPPCCELPLQFGHRLSCPCRALAAEEGAHIPDSRRRRQQQDHGQAGAGSTQGQSLTTKRGWEVPPASTSHGTATELACTSPWSSPATEGSCSFPQAPPTASHRKHKHRESPGNSEGQELLLGGCRDEDREV